MRIRWTSFVILFAIIVTCHLNTEVLTQGYGEPVPGETDVVLGETDGGSGRPGGGGGPSPTGTGPTGGGGGPITQPGTGSVSSHIKGGVDGCHLTAEDPDADCIPGRGGADYPLYVNLPATSFTCAGQQYPGFYADPNSQCQVFHVCQADGRQDSFLCPVGSVFSQRHFVCEWWYDVNCGESQSLYSMNANLFQVTGVAIQPSPGTTGEIPQPPGTIHPQPPGPIRPQLPDSIRPQPPGSVGPQQEVEFPEPPGSLGPQPTFPTIPTPVGPPVPTNPNAIPEEFYRAPPQQPSVVQSPVGIPRWPMPGPRLPSGRSGVKLPPGPSQVKIPVQPPSETGQPVGSPDEQVQTGY